MKKSITRNEWSTLILLLAVLFGTFIRFNPTMLAGFAINDGGMFAVMIDDLKSNGYLIPKVTTYNNSGIPFAYPPLGFYFGAITSGLLSMDAVEVVRWLPPFFASLSIPIFYLLSLRLLKNRFHASLSALMFALMPRAFFWFVMGGGLTRSAGQFFLLLALWAIVRLYEENRRVDIFLAGIFGGLAVLSHPEALVHGFISVLLFWLVLSRNRVTFTQSAFVGFLVVIFTLPWWGTEIRYHGIAPLLNATQTGGNALAVFHLVFLVFAEEPFVTFITVLGMIGLIDRFIRRDYLLPIWMAVPFLLAGRSAANLVVIPFAMLAAVGLGEVVLPAIQKSVKGGAELVDQVTPIERNVTLYLILYLVFSAYHFGYQLSNTSLQESDLDAMRWIKSNTPEDSRFLVLTGTTSVACDSVSEWFPALTERQSIYTIQGREWALGKNFGNFITQSVEVQACLNDVPSCLNEKAALRDYGYVYLERRLSVNNCAPLDSDADFKYFLEKMRAVDKFNVLYENDGMILFGVR